MGDTDLHAGIDPGRAGAAAIVDGDVVVWRCRWRVQPAGHVLVYQPDRDRIRLDTHGHLARWVADGLAGAAVARVLVEDQHVGRRSGVRSVLSLAHYAGALYGACEADGLECEWAGPRSWRPRVGISGSARAADAKRWAVDLVRSRAGIEVTTDEAEAVCMAWAVAGG